MTQWVGGNVTIKKGRDSIKSVSVLDVAQYILEHTGRLDPWKLQKLCYYAQVFSLVWDELPLFEEEIQAWTNGPAIPALYEIHQGLSSITKIPNGVANNLDSDQSETVDVVLNSYGNKSRRWLSARTITESPWQNARHRNKLASEERGNAVITLSDMIEYYKDLDDVGGKMEQNGTVPD